MSAVIDTHGPAHGAGSHDGDHHDHHGGYGGGMAWAIRLDLFQPGIQFFNPDLFNQFTTMHGLIMVFGAIMPAFVGFANWQIPMMIRRPAMAFARPNTWSSWLL